MELKKQKQANTAFEIQTYKNRIKHKRKTGKIRWKVEKLAGENH